MGTYRKATKSKHFALIGLLFLLTCAAEAQNKIDSKALQEDLHMLGDIITGTSPKLSPQNQTAIDSLIELNSQKLEGKPMDVVEFANFFSDIHLNTQFDEHAALTLGAEVLGPILNKQTLLPIPIKIIEDLVVVNAQNLSLLFGSVLHKINGEPVYDILRSLTREYNSHAIREIIEPQFPILYAIKKGGKEEYRISYSLPNDPSSILETTIKGVSIGEWVSLANEVMVYPLDRPKLENLINTLHYPEKKAFYIQLNSFSWNGETKGGLFERLRGDKKNFIKLFNETFQEIRKLKAERLIIDLRYNTGGNIEIPATLFQYIARQPFKESVTLEIPDFKFPHIDHIIQFDDSPIDKPKDLEAFTERYKREFSKSNSGFVFEFIEQQEVTPHKNAFTGEVYLLAGGRSISASSYFAALFRGEKRGVIVGEELGGSHQSITAGTDMIYQLPNTKIEVTVPLMVMNFDEELYNKVPEKKINPDIRLSEKESYSFFMKMQDPELEKILSLILKE